MADRIRIKTSDDNYVHFDTHKNTYTLCGLETGGDLSLGIHEGKSVSLKVNCPDCLRIVRFCKAIPNHEFLTK